jgi:hypothetical protein
LAPRASDGDVAALQAAKEALAKARPFRGAVHLTPRATLGTAVRASYCPALTPAGLQNLASKQNSWSAQAQASGGVIAEGVDAAGASTMAPAGASLPAVDKDTFYPTINGSGNQLVVVDFYTDWCVALACYRGGSEKRQSAFPPTLMSVARLPCFSLPRRSTGAARASS